MTGKAGKEEKSNSRELILAKSLELFTRKGYDGTSIDDIREAAGFRSKASLYTHFKNKEEVASALLAKILADEERVLQKAYEATSPEPLAQFRGLGRAFVEWGFTHVQEYAFCFLRIQQEVLMRDHSDSQNVAANEMMLNLVRQMRESYPVRAIADEALLSMVVGLVSKAVIDQQSFGAISLGEKVEQVMEMCMGLIFRGKDEL